MAAITWIASYASANFAISVAKPLDVDKGVQNEIVDTAKENSFSMPAKSAPMGLLAMSQQKGQRLCSKNGKTSHRTQNKIIGKRMFKRPKLNEVLGYRL